MLEVGTEEIPAWMIEAGLADLKRLLEESFERFGLTREYPVSLAVYATPRRLIAYCPHLPARQPSTVETVQGPPQRVAFDAAGKPTPAALGFAEKMGTPVEKLKTVSTPKGEYLTFRKKNPGKPTSEILRELIPQAVLGIAFPRSMYWEGKAGPRFIRPIRSLLVLYAGRVVPCSIGEVQSSATTFGHRFLGKPQLRVRDFQGYRQTLRDNFVFIDPAERRARILDGIQKLLASENGLRLRPDEELLQTLMYLTEHPTVLLGEFDPAFLSLPQEVLITVMRHHQKYFSIEQADGTLAPRFVAVMDLDADRTGVIRHGHERVLRARFNDARFFWETDAKLRLEQRLEMLRHVIFQSQLGSYHDKAQRMSKLAVTLAELLGHPEIIPDVRTAALLAKSDLTSDLVKEFPELQGVVGGLYARREGLSEEIATAIYDHYKPQNLEDSSPRTLIGALVSLADRMDTLVGFFGIGLAPSGSKDPYALRRAAQGATLIAKDHLMSRLNWRNVSTAAGQLYYEAHQRGELPAWDYKVAANELVAFVTEVRRRYFKDVLGFPYDEINAILGGEDTSEDLERLEALHRIRPTENFEPLAAAFKRIKNILEQARHKRGFTGGEVNPQLLEPGPELQLYEKYREVAQVAGREKQAGNYFEALEVIASLRPAVDRFFDKILVMAPQEEIRTNRLSLLDTLLNEFSIIADFSEIVTTDQTRTAAP
ncbi:MAG: glycine--tRNA ligase subunit beta [Acidobacteria bacterium]|nr:glycine--tRNA ligase subunit beta [Acidobacteriota bacterium]